MLSFSIGTTNARGRSKAPAAPVTAPSKVSSGAKVYLCTSNLPEPYCCVLYCTVQLYTGFLDYLVSYFTRTALYIKRCISHCDRIAWFTGAESHGPRGPLSLYSMPPESVRVWGLRAALSVKLAQVHITCSLLTAHRSPHP